MACIFVVAGEPSGDILGAELIAGLRKRHPSLSFCGVGGPLMEMAGSFRSIFPMTDLSHMGFGAIIARAPLFIRRFYEIVRSIEQMQPAGLLTIDSTDFCLRLGKKIKSNKKTSHIPRIQCVPPPVWAWRPKQARTLVPAGTDHVLSLFPFEEPFFRHMPYSFVGHPIMSSPKGCAELFWKTYGPQYGPTRPLLCLLPGSRPREIKTFWPILLETSRILRQQHPELMVATVRAPGTEPFWPLISDECLMIPSTDKHHLFAAATLALAASGTVSIELAYHGTPMILGYKVPKPTEWLLRALLTGNHVGLINILSDNPFVPEYLQGQFKPECLAKSALDVLNDPHIRAEQSKQSKATMEQLWAGDSFQHLGAAVISKTLGITTDSVG
ncbi:MAG: lipid-A-disaccharide synthase [Alphaproteobacteria bacterium]|nr:lipid-A-disaccharide synthase [Alphaproteobacteria bacterium]